MRAAGREIIMIGHRGHPEVEGTLGQADAGMYLVETPEDVAALQVRDPDNLAFVTQTTLSVDDAAVVRSEEHTSELQSLMRISYAVFCLKKKNKYLTPLQTTSRNNTTTI